MVQALPMRVIAAIVFLFLAADGVLYGFDNTRAIADQIGSAIRDSRGALIGKPW